jgi:serine/threonine protein kinase
MKSALKKVQAPEEMYGQITMLQEKIDVYLMGNMLYYILTSKRIFEGITREEAMLKLKTGKRSEIGFEPTDPADNAIVDAMHWAWTQDPQERPKAREVSDFLRRTLRTLESREEDYDLRVTIPPLPADYDFSDEEFYEHLGMDLDGNIIL